MRVACPSGSNLWSKRDLNFSIKARIPSNPITGSGAWGLISTTFAITGHRQLLHPTDRTESFRCIAVVMLRSHRATSVCPSQH